MSSMEHFDKCMANVARDVIGHNPDEFIERTARSAIAFLRGMEDPPSPLGSEGPKQRLARELLTRHLESKQSVEALQNIEIYIRRFPYSRTKVTKSAYLRYHVENYLHELYVLRERLLADAKIVQRRYRSDARIGGLKRAAEGLQSLVLKFLERAVTIRGAHVHDERYTDPELRRLSLLEGMANLDPQFMKAYDSYYRMIRRDRHKKLQHMNERLQKLLDGYYAVLSKALFTPDLKLRYPSSMERRGGSSGKRKETE